MPEDVCHSVLCRRLNSGYLSLSLHRPGVGPPQAKRKTPFESAKVLHRANVACGGGADSDLAAGG
ncbi:MAG: hypothetical protein OHK0029_41470 [Armatimonadaceae bacterium]